MRIMATILGIATTAAVLAPARLDAQTTPVKTEVRQDWTGMKDTMFKIAEAMPEDKFGYKSTPAQRSFGEQILHVASANVSVLTDVGAVKPPTINMKATSKAEILKALSSSFDYGTAIIDAQTDQSMLERVKPKFRVGDSTRSRVFYLLIGHAWDIYGQMAVYLRLNGITPPASLAP